MSEFIVEAVENPPKEDFQLRGEFRRGRPHSGLASFFIGGAGTLCVPGGPTGPPVEKAQICGFSTALTI